MGRFLPVVNCKTNGRARTRPPDKKAFSTSAAEERFTTDAGKAVVGTMPQYSPAQQGYKNDPFIIRNGHYVAHDGFVVPKDFEEFYERFPNYVSKWVSKNTDRFATMEDLEDWTNELLLHLCHVSEHSKHRKVGKEDIIQTFDPMKRGGANQARFWDYINLCLINKLRTMRSKRMKDALSRAGNLSLRAQAEEEDLGSAGDEYCHSHSEYLREAEKFANQQAQNRARVQQFENFVRREEPRLGSLIRALAATRTQAEAADFLRITKEEFARRYCRLRLLGRSFRTGERVPKRRRPYRRHTAMTLARVALSVVSVKC